MRFSGEGGVVPWIFMGPFYIFRLSQRGARAPQAPLNRPQPSQCEVNCPLQHRQWKKTDSLNTARYKMYMSRNNPPPLKKPPPTDSNLQLHVLRAQLQPMLWKAADQRHPPVDSRDIRRFGWDVKEGGLLHHLCPMHR